jgi:ABC-type multidrug transport system fused ATPase/permease subunit
MDLLNIHQLLYIFITKHKMLFIVYLILTVLLYPIHYITIPDYYGKVINTFKDKKENMFVHYIKILFIAYIAAWLLESCILWAQYKIIPNFSEFATSSIFEFIMEHYELDFENIHTGEILSKIIRIPGILFEYIDVVRVEFLKELFVFFTAIYKFYTVSNTAMFTYIFYVVINYIFVYIMFNVFSKYNVKVNKLQDRMYEYLVDCFNNLTSVYSFNQKDKELDRFHNVAFKEYKEATKENWLMYIRGDLFWGGVTVSMFVVMNYILYSAYLSKKIDSDKLVSMFIITFSIIRLYERSETTSKNIASVYGQIKDTEEFFNSISKFNKNENKTNKYKFRNGDIVFRNVYHKYNDTFVLENINLTIQKGEKVALVGQIGSGKSTLIKLLLGFQKLEMGTIEIDGISINDIPNENLRENIFYIPQKPKLFNRTLYENIVYGLNKAPTKEEVIGLLRDLKLDDIASAFEEKMDEECGVDGNSLSGGQRQIVWLLRSFYRNSRIIVLDEPTASLDPKNKKLMVSVIKKMSVGKTVIIVSHDNIDPMFRKIQLKNGRLMSSSYFD